LTGAETKQDNECREKGEKERRGGENKGESSSVRKNGFFRTRVH